MRILVTGFIITKLIVNKENQNHKVILAGILAGMLPDADVILRFWNNQAFIKYHRAVSHSIIYCIMTTVLLQLIKPKYPQFKFL